MTIMRIVCTVIGILMYFAALSQGGPDEFILDGCTTAPTDMNGTYKFSGLVKNGAKCYTKEGSTTLSIEFTPGGEWVIGDYSLDAFTPCDLAGTASLMTTISTSTTTDITKAMIGGANCSVGRILLTKVVPTLGQWGTIVLTLTILILGLIGTNQVVNTQVLDKSR